MNVTITLTDAQVRDLQDALQVSTEQYRLGQSRPDQCDPHARRILLARQILGITTWPMADAGLDAEAFHPSPLIR